MTRLLAFVAATVAVVATAACADGGSINPAAPSVPASGVITTPATRDVPWSSLPPLSAEGKALVTEFNLNSVYEGRETIGAVKRWREFPVSVAAPEFSEESLSAAIEFWQNETGGKVSFHVVASGAAVTLTFDSLIMDACGREGPTLVRENIIVAGMGRYATRPECASRSAWRIGLAHGLGHILGFGGHTPSGTDLMGSPLSVWGLSPPTSEAFNWLHQVEPGTRPY